MSGGHLCEAEAPTEPTGETADPYKVSITLLQRMYGEGLCALLPLRIIISFRQGEDTPPYDTKKEPEGIGFLKSYD